MTKKNLKKHNVLFLAAMTFLFVFVQQDISGANESKFPENGKIKMLWEFDSGG
ncbi:MAG: hypothetical protein PVH61_05260 [Candidatus Aminicenantes bacterium]|jgi:hypothetical protein